MKTINSAAVAFLAMFAAAPALAQNSEEFFGNICEIDTSRLPLGNNPYVTPDGTQSVYTFSSQKLCTGVASKRNIKLTCTAPLPNWGTEGTNRPRTLSVPSMVINAACHPRLLIRTSHT